jgi:anti-sigma regulatory factor (Ser/Thr protein kinase)
MSPYLEYRSQRYSTLSLEIDPGTEFRQVVDDFGELRYPPIGVNHDLVGFALLELVSNSIRAHKEHGVDEPVRVTFAATDRELGITVLDSGRGFNPALLPYDIGAPVETVDLMGDAFASYRDRSGGSRFGMGIYSARKIFPRFSIAFVDRSGSRCPWFAGAVRGTRIDLGIGLLPSAPERVSTSAGMTGGVPSGARFMAEVEAPMELAPLEEL